MHGQGTYMFANGDLYDGAYDEGKRHGVGVLAFADGRYTVGGKSEVCALCHGGVAR